MRQRGGDTALKIQQILAECCLGTPSMIKQKMTKQLLLITAMVAQTKRGSYRSTD